MWLIVWTFVYSEMTCPKYALCWRLSNTFKTVSLDIFIQYCSRCAHTIISYHLLTLSPQSYQPIQKHRMSNTIHKLYKSQKILPTTTKWLTKNDSKFLYNRYECIYTIALFIIIITLICIQTQNKWKKNETNQSTYTGFYFWSMKFSILFIFFPFLSFFWN